MPLYEFYCENCHGIFEEIRQMREASLPAPCPQCAREAPRIMSGFTAFTLRDGYPRRIPDKGTYWHMGKEVKTRARSMSASGEHPELVKPEPRPRTARGDAVTSLEKRITERADALYRDKWGVKADGMRSVKAKKIKPERKAV
jgi:putative FmdB family regulatory protein